MFRIMNKLKNRKGFTLIELIVVLAVLAVIMAIAVPRFLSVQDDAKLSADHSTAAMIGKAAELYLADTSHKVSDLSGKTGVQLATLLKTTEIKFTSSTYSGKEDSITFDDTTGIVIVKVNGTKLYPK